MTDTRHICTEDEVKHPTKVTDEQKQDRTINRQQSTVPPNLEEDEEPDDADVGL